MAARRRICAARIRAILAAACLACALAVVAVTVAGGATGPNKPHATFTFSPSSPQSGDTVTFTSTSIPAKNNVVTVHEWDLDGDGSYETNTGASPTATSSYPTARTVQARLRITQTDGRQDQSPTVPVTIRNRAPTASFAWSPPFPLPGQPVTFTSTATDPDGAVVSEAWDLDGDGNFDNGGGLTALRSFATAGSYVVGLRTTDDLGVSSFQSKTVTVQAPAGAPVSKQASSRPRLISPFPVVRIAGRITKRGAVLHLLVVSAPRGTKVSVRCDGHGCPFSKQVRAAARPGARAAVRIRVRRLERLLPAGVVVKVFVTKHGFVGKYTRFKIRGGEPPARADRCLPPGSWRPIKCPAA